MTGVLKHWNGTAWVPALVAPSGRTGPLAVKSYNPASFENKSTTSTTLVDVDAANLAVTITAPPSGQIIVVLTGDGATSGPANTDYVLWGLRSGGAVVAGTSGVVVGGPGRSRATHRMLVTGLTPGASYTYTWAHATSSGDTASLYVGDVNGPAVMEVWDAVGSSGGGGAIVQLTQAEYDALGTPDPDTLYVIVG